LIVEPGSFVLVGVEDKFCKAKIPSSSKCVIQPVLPPSFAFTSSPIEESCFGAVGANVDLSFTGEGPFWLEYTLEKTALNGGDQRVEKIPHDREVFRKNRASLVLKPKEPGIYRYVFDRVNCCFFNDVATDHLFYDR
jgi:nucleoporin POM152